MHVGETFQRTEQRLSTARTAAAAPAAADTDALTHMQHEQLPPSFQQFVDTQHADQSQQQGLTRQQKRALRLKRAKLRRRAAAEVGNSGRGSLECVRSRGRAHACSSASAAAAAAAACAACRRQGHTRVAASGGSPLPAAIS